MQPFTIQARVFQVTTSQNTEQDGEAVLYLEFPTGQVSIQEMLARLHELNVSHKRVVDITFSERGY